MNDDDALLMTFKIMLKSPKRHIVTAATYDEAVKKYAEEKIDVILSDINLGNDVPNGYEFLRHVRELDTGVPFYMVSGYSASDEEQRAMEMGASGYLQLPLEEKVLSEILA